MSRNNIKYNMFEQLLVYIQETFLVIKMMRLTNFILIAEYAFVASVIMFALWIVFVR